MSDVSPTTSRASGPFLDATDEAVCKFSFLCSNMKVYKQMADNIHKQIQILYETSKFISVPIGRAFDDMCAPINFACRTLESLVERSTLRNCLSHKIITSALDTLHNNIEPFLDKHFHCLRVPYHRVTRVQSSSSNDECTLEATSLKDQAREEIGFLREMYEALRQADVTELKRTLRFCLRSSSFQQLLEELGVPALNSVKLVMKAELASNDTLSSDMRLHYEKLIENIDLELLQNTFYLQLDDLTSGLAPLGELTDRSESSIQSMSADYFGRRIDMLYPPLMFLAKDIPSFNATLKMSADETLHLQHPNVVPVLGTFQIRNIFGTLSHDLHSPVMGLVIPNTVHIFDYLQQHPDGDRLKLMLGMAKGLAFLHANCLDLPTFGDCRTSLVCNMKLVCVNEEGEASISGLADLTLWTASVSERKRARLSTKMRYHNMATDLELLALMMFKLLTYQHPRKLCSPFDDLDACRHISHTRHSIRRAFSAALARWSPGSNEELNDLFHECTSGRGRRDTSLLNASAVSVANAVQKLVDARDSLAFMIDLTACIIPSSLKLACVTGGFGEVHLARMRDGTEVALKSLKVKAAMAKWRQNKRFQREAMIWKDLNHANVLRLIGKADVQGLQTTCLVSPWMKNGTCIDYMRVNRNIRCMPMIIGIARGLAYLHTHRPKVIHGDLRSPNVLISDRGEPLLCDFGLAIVIEEITKVPVSTAFLNCGNPCWMAPELFVGTDTTTEQSDVWALAMVMFEMVTLRMPFSELRNFPNIIIAIAQGRRPEKPGEDALERGFTDELWALMQSCWAHNQISRPTSSEVLGRLERMSSNRLSRAFDDMDTSR